LKQCTHLYTLQVICLVHARIIDCYLLLPPHLAQHLLPTDNPTACADYAVCDSTCAVSPAYLHSYHVLCLLAMQLTGALQIQMYGTPSSKSHKG
jgi:hypothetical protein